MCTESSLPADTGGFHMEKDLSVPRLKDWGWYHFHIMVRRDLQ